MPDSITHCIDRLKAGDRDAAQVLWERYFDQVVRLSRKLLQSVPRQAADEEDVAVSAFKSLWRGIERDRFPQLFDRDNLWRLLLVITRRKAIDHIHRQRCRRLPTGSEQPGGVEGIADAQPTPDLVALLADQCRHLLGRLDDPDLRQIALWKMEGYSNEEIAGRLGCVVRTVERRLRLIRTTWKTMSVC